MRLWRGSLCGGDTAVALHACLSSRSVFMSALGVRYRSDEATPAGYTGQPLTGRVQLNFVCSSQQAAHVGDALHVVCA